MRLLKSKGLHGLCSVHDHEGSFQNFCPILVPLNIRCCNTIYNPKGPIIFRTTQEGFECSAATCSKHVDTSKLKAFVSPEGVYRGLYRVQGLGSVGVDRTSSFFLRAQMSSSIQISNPDPKAPSYLNSRLLGYVAIGCLEPRTHYSGNWSPRVSPQNPKKGVQ